jgi:hypothetical protein
MLTLAAPQAEALWDELLPVEARQLPEDLAQARIGRSHLNARGGRPETEVRLK